ncbi:MAG: hypothetical protein IJZ87_09335 [Bacteroidales bacterium]|nr:hypothetical protein [Bacteroidales bacterium]
MDYIRICRDVSHTSNDIKELLKDWVKLYPNSFAPDVDFKIFQLENGDFIIQLHEDISSLAVSLLILYFENSQQTTDNRQQTSSIAYITIDDTEILLKQNEGKRAMVFSELGMRNEELGIVSASDSNQPTSVRFLLEDNYVLDYNFEKRAKPVKDSGLVFNEEEFNLPEEFETVRVGDVVKKNIDKVLEEEGLTPKKMLIYFLCGAIGLSIGFLIVYFMGGDYVKRF